MALADPQSIKISGTTHSLPRVSTGDYKSKYEKDDGTIDLLASTQNGKRKRQVVRVDHSKVVASTLIPSQNEEISSSYQLVVDRPLNGYTNADALAILAGFFELLTGTENAVLKKVLASES